MPEQLDKGLLPVLAWVLFLARPARGDHGRQCVRWVLLGLAVSLTALNPHGYAAIARLSGDHELPRLVGHAGMLFATWAAQQFLVHLNGVRARWHTWWIVGVFALMCLLFALTPDLKPQSPWVMEYCVAYAVAQAPAFGAVVWLCLRYARLTNDLALRAGLWLVVLGTTGALAYLANKTALALAPRFDFSYPLGRTLLPSKVLPASSHALVLLGATLPTLVGWVTRYRLYLRLRPLWQALYRADPAIALDPPGFSDVLVARDLRLRLYRRVIEIRDGLLGLQPYRDPRVAAEAREGAVRAGLRGQQLAAAVEAAAIRGALRARARGVVPVEVEPAGTTGGGDHDSDAAFLGRVAWAYGRVPDPRVIHRGRSWGCTRA